MNNKVEELRQQYDILKGVSMTLTTVEQLAKKKLTEFVEKYGKVLMVEFEQGVPHTAFDFHEDDEDGQPKQKRLCGLYTKDGKLVAQFTDNTESDSFAIDDIAYLIDEIYIEYVLDDVAQDEDNID